MGPTKGKGKTKDEQVVPAKGTGKDSGQPPTTPAKKDEHAKNLANKKSLTTPDSKHGGEGPPGE